MKEAHEGKKLTVSQGFNLQDRDLWTKLLTPGLDNTRLFMSLTAGAGTRCMSLLSSPTKEMEEEIVSDRW